MNDLVKLFTVSILGLIFQNSYSESTTPAIQIDNLVRFSRARPNPSRGQEFFITKHGNEWSCSSCHTKDPTVFGKHVKTGKEIQPMAPSANPDRFTDAAKTEKWFRRNCNDVVGRECTPEEKANIISWLLSLKNSQEFHSDIQ